MHISKPRWPPPLRSCTPTGYELELRTALDARTRIEVLRSLREHAITIDEGQPSPLEKAARERSPGVQLSTFNADIRP